MSISDITFLAMAASRRLLLSVGMSILPFSSLRVMLLKSVGVKIGKGCYIGFNVYIDTNFPFLVSIGDNVTISHGCCFVTHTISPVDSPLSKLYSHLKPVTIHDGAWIGMNSMLLPGSSVGSNSMIGAGSIVTASMPSSHMCAGNPCQAIKELNP